MKRLMVAALVALAAGATASAQSGQKPASKSVQKTVQPPAQQAVAIDPGMTREQVVAKLGQPLSSRDFQGFTYLLYRNGCEKTCGMNDLVVLDSGKVVDAVFRATGRTYTGTSSSPRMISKAEASRGKPDAPAKPITIKKPAT